MKILMVTPEYPPISRGGIGQHVRALRQALRSVDIDVTIFTTCATTEDAAKVDEPGVIWARQSGPVMSGHVGWSSSPITMLQNNIAMTAALNQIEATATFDVVHCQGIYAALAADTLANVMAAPLVLTEHSNPHKWVTDRSASVITQRDAEYFTELRRWIYPRAVRLITVSRDVQEQIRFLDAEAANRCVAIHNSGHHILDHPAKESPKVVRQRIGRDDERILLVLGRIVWQKGGDIAIRALKLLSRPGWRVVFVGTGALEDDLRRLAIELGLEDQVTFAGHLDGSDLVDILLAADAVLAPSLLDPCPLTVAEALTLGKVVIGSDVGGIKEQIEHGHTGLLCVPENPEDLARNIQWIFQHPDEARELAMRAKEYALAYSWGTVAHSTVKQYQIAMEICQELH